jgi:hypothetical protein
MSAGYIQLAAIGQQDAYLTGSPQVTYFLGVYRRHTPFVLEAYDIPFVDQSLQYGQNNICRIPPKGDLVRALTLKMTLPGLRAPGINWYWETPPSFSNTATLIFNGNWAQANVGVFGGLDYYSTYNMNLWLTGTGRGGIFKSNVSYDLGTNKFTFNGASNVWVKPYTRNATNCGLFWGLDPKAADSVVTAGGETYLVYNVGNSGRPADFSLEQAGWLRNPGTGMPDPASRTGFFLQLDKSLTVTSSQMYMNFGSVMGINYWTVYDTSTALYTVTTGGRLKFINSGNYIMRVCIGVQTGYVTSIGYGASTTEDGPPGIVSLTYSYPFNVYLPPLSVAVFPITITDVTSTVYVYVSATPGTSFNTSSYVSINPADEYYTINSSCGSQGVGLPGPEAVVPFFSNVNTTYSAYLSPNNDGSFKFTGTGPVLITGVISPYAGYVSNVSLVSDTTGRVYTYDLSSQGRIPTFPFTIPVNVTDTTVNYSITVATTNQILLMPFPDVLPIGTGSVRNWQVIGTYGTFTMNSSTLFETSGFEPWRAFTPMGYWQASPNGLYSLAPPYANVTTGGFTSATTPVNPTVYGGEWIQLASTFAYKLYSITIGAASVDSAPGECMIFGNNSEGNFGWTILMDRTTLSGSTDTLTINSGTAYKWIRIAFTKAFNGTDVPKPQVQVSVQGYGPNILLNNSYFIFSQIGVMASTIPSVVFPYNGLLFTPSTTIFNSNPLRLTTDYNLYGNSLSFSNLTMSNSLSFPTVGTYMISGALCTTNQISQIRINSNSGVGSVTYPIALGTSPPYSVNIPFHVKNVTDTWSISVTVDGASANMYSNTFLAVIPIALTAYDVKTYYYYDSVATLAVKTVDLKIGGQLIQSLTGEYIELWNDLNIPYENQPALKLLTGKGDAPYPILNNGQDTTEALQSRTYYVNLPFYFYGHPELALPLVALGRQDVEVHVTFNTFTNLTPFAGVTNPTIDATIITEYVYLSEPEMNWFRNNRIEQVITQCQYGAFDLQTNFATGVFSLEFRNPIRELFFVVQPTTNYPYDYSLNGVSSMSLSFNGYDAFTTTTTDDVYLGSLVPFDHYVNFPTRKFYIYSFCSLPLSANPSGYVNFSRIKQVLLTLNTDPSVTPKQLRICGVNHNVLRFESGLAGLMFNN